jgi:peptide/nickel transport system substrate-binding protein
MQRAAPAVHPSARKLLFPAAIGLPLVLLLLAAALFGVRGGRTAPAEGGWYVESAPGPVERINPLLAVSPAERDLAELIFAGLTRVGPTGEPIPDLAEEWDTSPDARVFTFRLRRDLTWQDGAPVRVEDAVFTLTLRREGYAVDPRLTEVWQDAIITRVDDRRVRVELAAPFAGLPAYAGVGLLPEHLLRDVPITGFASAAFNRRPVGAGPFRLLELHDSGARLGRYDRYHLGAPYLDGIDFRFTAPADEGAAVLTGTEATGNRVTHTVARDAYAVVFLNNDSPLFATDTVRKALSVSIDRRALVARTLGGRGVPADVPFAPRSWAADGLEPEPPNVELAKALLASAGWSPGADGVLRRGNRELRFTLVTADEPAWTAVARALADTWGQIGVRVTVAPARESALLSEFLNPRAYEAVLVGWDPGADPDPFTAWHSSLRATAGGNPANFADEQMDTLLVEARAVPDLDARLDRYARFQARFRQLVPSIVLFAEVVRYVAPADARLSLPSTVPDPAARFTDVRRWHLVTRRAP